MNYFFELLIEMTKRELSARYKNTLFGFLWIVINPLIQMLVIGFVFPLFIKNPVPNYHLYILVGLLVWNFFSISLNKATSSVFNERNLIKKANFPKEIIPLSIILSNFIHLFVALMIILLPISLTYPILSPNFAYIILGMILLIVFTTGLSLLTSSLNVRFRDVNFFVQAVLIIWFYATPIVYSIKDIPYELIWIWRLNPMTSIVQFFQHALANSPAPGPAMFAINTFITLITFIVGVKVFKRQSRYFDDWI